jgi:predicted GTPase
MILDVNDVNIDLQNKEITPKDPKQFKKLESSFLMEKTVILLNKSDTLGAYDGDIKEFPFKWNGVTCRVFQLISCKQNQGVQNFIEKIAEQVNQNYCICFIIV